MVDDRLRAVIEDENLSLKFTASEVPVTFASASERFAGTSEYMKILGLFDPAAICFLQRQTLRPWRRRAADAP
jgi:hypothetical protein